MFYSCITGANKDQATNINSDYYFVRNPDAKDKGYINTYIDSNIIKKYELLYNENNSKLLTDFWIPDRRPSIYQLDITESGRIEMMVCVDRTGKTTYVKVLPENTSIYNKNILKKAVNYLGSFIWEGVNTPLKEECGKYTLIIDNKTR
jgi:hypothetical protein